MSSVLEIKLPVRVIGPDNQAAEDAMACEQRIAEGPLLFAGWRQKLAHWMGEARSLADTEYDECIGRLDSEDFKLDMPLSPPSKSQGFSTDERLTHGQNS